MRVLARSFAAGMQGYLRQQCMYSILSMSKSSFYNATEEVK